MRFLAGDFLYFTSNRFQISTLPHFRGLIVPKIWHKDKIDLIEEIKTITGGEETLILSVEGSIIYLAGNLKNPTPFDFYSVNAFGTDGEQKVIDKINSTQIKFVYINPLGTHPLAPRKLEQYVSNNCTLVVDLSEKGFGYIYTSP
jgi:hypothetical protein